MKKLFITTAITLAALGALTFQPINTYAAVGVDDGSQAEISGNGEIMPNDLDTPNTATTGAMTESDSSAVIAGTNESLEDGPNVLIWVALAVIVVALPLGGWAIGQYFDNKQQD